jgi:hypothetical protein
MIGRGPTATNRLAYRYGHVRRTAMMDATAATNARTVTVANH